MARDDRQIYSLVALDIDGTMIGDDRIVKPDLIAAISRVQSTGAIVSVSTGRTLKPALKIAQEAGAHGPVICFQGAMTFDQQTQETLRHERLEEVVATQAIEGMRSVIPELMMFLGNDVWVEQRTDWTDGYGQRMGVSIRDIDSLLKLAHRNPTAIVGVGEPEIVRPLVDKMHAQLNGSALVTHSLPMFCEVEAIGAGKDLAVEHLANSLGIDRSEVIAVGDGKGDQSMIEWAGLGVAVEGGHVDAVAAADTLVGSPEQSGLSRFLDELCDTGRFDSVQG